MQQKLRIVAPITGRTPYYYIRGSYDGVANICFSTRSTDCAVAKRRLAETKAAIKRGEFRGSKDSKLVGPLTFAKAAEKYLDKKERDGELLSSNDKSFIARLVLHFDATPVVDIDQDAVDAAAATLLPCASPATRNREVYTPASAILRCSKVVVVLERPEGAQGKQRRHWLRPEHANAFLAAAWQKHPRFAALCTTLLYCGCRLSEALALQVEDLHLDLAFADIGETKNGDPQRLHLPPIVVHAIRLALLEPGNATWNRPEVPRSKGSVFHLTKSGALYQLFDDVEEASGVTIPAGVSFHIFRHTFGAWTHGAGGRLEETGRWTSRAGAKPYDHYEITDAAKVADRFPGASGGAPTIKKVG